MPRRERSAEEAATIAIVSIMSDNFSTSYTRSEHIALKRTHRGTSILHSCSRCNYVRMPGLPAQAQEPNRWKRTEPGRVNAAPDCRSSLFRTRPGTQTLFIVSPNITWVFVYYNLHKFLMPEAVERSGEARAKGPRRAVRGGSRKTI